MAEGRASVADTYRMGRDFGLNKNQARRQAIIDACRDDERRQIEMGITYDGDEVRQAVVHSRQDIVLLSCQLDEVIGEARSIRRWLIALVILVGLTLWVLVGR
jgi:hypothetical protein